MPAIACAFSVDDLEVPPGYSISVYAHQVENARQLALSGDGLLFAGSRDAGLVHAIIDEDGDYVADRVIKVATDLRMPSGVAVRDDHLYVAEVHQVTRYAIAAADGSRLGQGVVVVDDLPGETHHGWKFIAFSPDGRLHVPVGAPCNVCAPPEPFATILRFNANFETRDVVARGVRNSVGFDWHPDSGELWFSDNGRDWLGDDLPPGEINRVARDGDHFGFPYRHGGGITDPEFSSVPKDLTPVPPQIELGAHVAPLGIEFYRGSMFPAEPGRVLFVAEHGSWNRSRKAGYRVMRAVISDNGRIVRYEPFVTGWLKGAAHWGRPVDFEVLTDGSLLISDDYSNRIFRVVYEGG